MNSELLDEFGRILHEDCGLEITQQNMTEMMDTFIRFFSILEAINRQIVSETYEKQGNHPVLQ
jgi:hypothetical protein